MTSRPVIHQPMQEMQEHAAVARARAGNIAEHDQRPLADFAVAPRQVDHMAARAQRLPQGAPHIDALARMIRLEAPREEFAALQAQARDGLLGLHLLGQRHLLEILGAQDVIGGRREGRVKLQHLRFFLAAALRFVLVEHGFRQPAKARILRLFAGGAGDLLET